MFVYNYSQTISSFFSKIFVNSNLEHWEILYFLKDQSDLTYLIKNFMIIQRILVQKFHHKKK